MKKKQLILLETLAVIFALSLLAWFMIPKFLFVNQNINREKYFPDPKFRSAVERFMEVEPNGFFTAEQAAAKTGVLDFTSQNVKSVTGLEYIKSVSGINAINNQIIEIDLSNQTELESIYIADNQLIKLDVSNNKKLITLLCNGNKLQEINLAEGGELYSLIAMDNNLTSIDISKCASLVDLFIGGNQIKELDLSQNPELKQIRSLNGQLTSIDVTKNTNLKMLQIISNQLTAFPDLSNNNQLEVVDLRLNNIGCDSAEAIEKFKKTFEGNMSYAFQYAKQKNTNLDDCIAEN